MLKRFLLARQPAKFPRLRFFSSSAIESLVLGQYHAGRFHNLLAATILHPSVLDAAARSLAASSLSSPATFPSISLIADSLKITSHCVKIQASRIKGEHLVLPDLHLKVLIEAVRLVLEVVFDSRLATFAYGGRASLGRHTAIRYLKTSVQNPSWWFRPVLYRQPFDRRHVARLTAVMREKISDPPLLSLIECLFESGAVGFHLGGVDLGRGLPQESGLCLILLNIYLDSLDREIQEIRSEIHRENARIKDPSLEGSSMVFHKPVRVYAVRYLDEVLVITSGSKMLTISIKDRILKYLEGELGLKVDKLKSSVHSAESEKMQFMGFELQAVLPSVLHPPMSEKAIRAKKKYLKRKAARAQELKNARETRRKKLGLKILKHCFKKLKRCQGHLKFDFKIENAVGEIFRGWAHEVVAEFLKNREECWTWHRMLNYGDFLSLKRVRDQLPQDLVDAYDQFQENVDKYLMPVKPSKVIEEEERIEEEEEARKYSKQTVEDLAELCMRVNAPIELVRRAVKLAGFTNSMGRPRPIKLLICLDDVDIIKWYAGVGRRWLEFFCCCRNFKMVKTVVDYHLRFSCFLTLAEKHESTKLEAIKHYTKALRVIDGNDKEVNFPTERQIKMMGDNNLSDPMPVDGALCLILTRLASNEPNYCCVAHFCDRMDTTLYRVRLLQNRLNVDPLKEDKWVPGMGAIHESLNKKCFPLCSEHTSALLLGRIALQDIDCASFVNVE